jgi:mRNA-degrading endonuclease toxin of MazEF toxin-antitoxin module
MRRGEIWWAQLIRLLTTLPPEVMVQVDQALKFAFGLD